MSKVATLFMILGAGWKQFLMTIDIVNVIIENEKAVLVPNKTLKHTNSKNPLKPFEYRLFKGNAKLCGVDCLHSYAGERNAGFKDVGKLLITHGKPYKEASADTNTCWVK